MKRAVARVKRKKAGTGAKRKAPGRRAAAQSASAPAKTRRTARRKPVAKVKVTDPRRVITKRKTIARKPRLKIPAILLEGDEPEFPALSGPGEKFALGPETPAAHFTTATAHLPAAYGTGRLFLTARDPHWLYAHWDINTATQFQHNAKSVDRHLILRMHEGDGHAKPAAEIHVHPESRHWFAHVERAGKEYVADLGYYQTGHQWKSLATSAPMRTPPESVSTDSTVEFATIPLDLPFETMLALLQERGGPGPGKNLPLARAMESLRTHGDREFPPPGPIAGWTPQQERALAAMLSPARTGALLSSSQAISELVRGNPEGESWPTGAGEFDLSSFLGESVFSPLGGGENVDGDFWFSVNAELIIYGATQPDANVTIGGKQITLRPDGSFSFHFALPDGQYELPIVAVSAAGADGRAAELKFMRTTELHGSVGVPLQDPALDLPTPDNV